MFYCKLPTININNLFSKSFLCCSPTIQANKHKTILSSYAIRGMLRQICRHFLFFMLFTYIYHTAISEQLGWNSGTEHAFYQSQMLASTHRKKTLTNPNFITSPSIECITPSFITHCVCGAAWMSYVQDTITYTCRTFFSYALSLWRVNTKGFYVLHYLIALSSISSFMLSINLRCNCNMIISAFIFSIALRTILHSPLKL